jgi:hypothetical protein
LMKAGRPTTHIPSPTTVARDIKTLFEKSQECVDNILKVRFMFPFRHYKVTYLWDRNIRAIFIWLQMLGHRQIIGCLLHGLFISLTKVISSPSC